MNARYHLQFTEEMKGWFAFGEDDFERGYQQGKDDGSALMFHLTIATEDVRRFIDDPAHVADARGWLSSEVLGGRLPVEKGIFNLFVTDGPHSRRMLYRLHFQDGVGRALTLAGHKNITGGGLGEVWPQTTTLYTEILRGHVTVDDADAPLVGRGTLRIETLDFARQLTTFRVRGPGLGGRLAALGSFGGLFVGQLLVVFDPLRRHAVEA